MRRVLEFVDEERSTVANSDRLTPQTAVPPVKADLAPHRPLSDCGVKPVQPAWSLGSTAPRGNALVSHHIPGSALETVPARKYEVPGITSIVALVVGFISVCFTENRVAVTTAFTSRSQLKKQWNNWLSRFQKRYSSVLQTSQVFRWGYITRAASARYVSTAIHLHFLL